MTFEEFEKADAEELRQQAKASFDKARKFGESWGGAPTLLLEAQFYMMEMDRRRVEQDRKYAEIHRKRDAKIAERDFRMEVVVIFLILLELIAAIIGIVMAIREGKEQAQVLEQLRK